jgi:hypothetical protein
MKVIPSLLLFALLGTPALSQNVPTPEMALEFNLAKDSKKWSGHLIFAKPSGFMFEFAPLGQTLDAWTEMVEQQIGFTRVSLKDFVDDWKLRMTRADPKLGLNEQTEKDGSILVAYASSVGQEISVRRFIKANDGIYMLAYLVRPSARDEGRLKLWIDIISTATLVKNPNLK